MTWTVDWRVLVGDTDVTTDMSGWLTRIETMDRDGAVSDTCTLTFDDTHGRIRMPAQGAGVHVHLQGIPVFDGVAQAPRSSGSRGSGRILTVKARGFDARGRVKEPQTFHADDTDLASFLGQAARQAGFTLAVDGSLGSIARDYWAADGESFLHLGQRLARELNATFKIRGTRAVLAMRGADKGLPTVTARPGANLISWDITPAEDRPAFTAARVAFFDRATAAVRTIDTDYGTGGGLPDAVNLIRTSAADEDQAMRIGEARRREAEREAGSGSVRLDLEPRAQAEGTLILAGARPGVDGTYRIASVRHAAERSGGATTSLEIRQPQGTAGRDER